MAWYCISFGLIARYHTVMYRCYSAPANYRVVHLVILPDMEKSNSASSSWSTFPKGAEVFASSMCGFHHYNAEIAEEVNNYNNQDDQG